MFDVTFLPSRKKLSWKERLQSLCWLFVALSTSHPLLNIDIEKCWKAFRYGDENSV